ncbi:hypothetical protein ACFFJY_10010 [Fictibacillus aquaticus]|nr:hypothetical protein [Fictibacillus aquaticus]
MNNKNYSAADLSDDLVTEIQNLEERISAQANKKVVVIAYENGSDLQ